MRLLFLVLCLAAVPATAQQLDPVKLGSAYQQQRNMAYDSVAQCAVSVSDLQMKIADLERQLAEAKKEQTK